jgi:coenzyme F420-0:L-glutamate ligase/coenzyme F420-1:gamma-L-glutamate ligase
MPVTITPLEGLPAVRPGDDLADLLLRGFGSAGLSPADGDILVVCQKVVSKAENRLIDLRRVTPSPFAERLAAATDNKDARAIEVILRETKRIVRMGNGNLIVETGPGWVCANAGVDESNSGGPHTVVLLPLDPDASARRIRDAVCAQTGRAVAVIITDTFGRPWRLGLIDFALGVAGMPPLLDLRGGVDLDGRVLQHTIHAQADALAAAAGLVMRKGAGIPAVLVRGYDFAPGEGSGRELIRDRQTDLFR